MGRQTKLSWVVTHDILVFALYTLEKLFRLRRRKKEMASIVSLLLKTHLLFSVHLGIVFRLPRADYSLWYSIQNLGLWVDYTGF